MNFKIDIQCGSFEKDVNIFLYVLFIFSGIRLLFMPTSNANSKWALCLEHELSHKQIIKTFYFSQSLCHTKKKRVPVWPKWRIPFSSFVSSTKQHSNSNQLMLTTRREYYFNIFNLDNSFPVLEFPNEIIRARNKQKKKKKKRGDPVEIACYWRRRSGDEGGWLRMRSGKNRNLWAWVNIFLLDMCKTITDCGFDGIHRALIFRGITISNWQFIPIINVRLSVGWKYFQVWDGACRIPEHPVLVCGLNPKPIPGTRSFYDRKNKFKLSDFMFPMANPV